MTIYRLTASGSLPAEVFNFGIHADGPAGTAGAAATAWASALTSFWSDGTTGADVVFSADVSILAAHAAELDSGTHRQVDAAEVVLALTGTDAGDMLPHEVAVAISTQAASISKKNKGRFYLPPPSVAQITNGRLATTPRARLLGAAELLINSLQGDGYTPVILHPDFTSDAIALVRVGDVPDVQRRRRNKLVESYVSAGV